jgi:hypothetical protein
MNRSWSPDPVLSRFISFTVTCPSLQAGESKIKLPLSKGFHPLKGHWIKGINTIILQPMDRKAFTQKLALLGVCPFVITQLTGNEIKATNLSQDEDLKQAQQKKQFIENWLSDLLESMEQQLDRETQEKIVGKCGVGCYNRHSFKQDIATNSHGDLEKLIENYSRNFEVWKDGATVHIRYGAVSSQCYCPAANYRTPKPNDIHCECTRNTHKTIFETALGKPVRVEIAESLRRGGQTCHFIVFPG